MLANHLNSGSRSANMAGIRLSGLSKLSATKSAKGQTLLHFMIDKLHTKKVSLLAIEDDFPSLVEACVLSSTTMRQDKTNLKIGLEKLIRTMEDADMNGNDIYMEKFAGVKDRFEVLTEAVCDKYDQAQSLYGEACEYMAEDPTKMSHEDFFKLLRAFIDTFKSTRKRAEDVRVRNAKLKKKEEAKRRKEEAKAARGGSRVPPKKKKIISANDSKTKNELLMERRKRMSVTQDIVRSRPHRKVLRGKNASSSDSSSSDSSSEDSSSSDEVEEETE